MSDQAMTAPTKPSAPIIESLLLAAARVVTFERKRLLTNASAFFFQRDERLFLVTSRHVMFDKPSKHFPDRIEVELHTDPQIMANSTGFSIPLYRNGKSIWRVGSDTAGEIDVAVIEIERSALPKTAVNSTLSDCPPSHLMLSCDKMQPVVLNEFTEVLNFHDGLNIPNAFPDWSSRHSPTLKTTSAPICPVFNAGPARSKTPPNATSMACFSVTAATWNKWLNRWRAATISAFTTC
jgi:hypothetical protein